MTAQREQTEEFQKFDKAVRKIFSVSPEELKRKRDEWEKGRQRKRGPKPSASVRVSSSKG